MAVFNCERFRGVVALRGPTVKTVDQIRIKGLEYDIH